MCIRVRSALLLASAVFALAGCAAAPQAGDEPAAVSAQEPFALTAAETQQSIADGPDTVVCRFEQQTGSRFKKKVCRTRAEIDQMSRDARESMKSRDRGSGNSNEMQLPTGG